MEIKFAALEADEIEVKVKKVLESEAIGLLYKTSRVDMDRLDETVGSANWCDDYKSIDGVLYCGVGIKSTNEWIWKWSNGIESREDNGNEKKGEASDAFKRAGFLWGIGRELYTAPFIRLNVETTNKDGKYYLKDKKAKFNVGKIAYDDKRRISGLVILDRHGKVVFSYGFNSKELPEVKQVLEKPKVCPICGKAPEDFETEDGKIVKGSDFLAKYKKCQDCYWKEREGKS